MQHYEDGRVRKLAEQLDGANVEPAVIDRILVGSEQLGRASKPVQKAEWMKGAMARMDQLLDEETRHSVREGCACCLGGKRLAISRGIGKGFDTLEERIAAANEARFVFGHSVTLQDDGKVLVRFAPEGQGPYRCVCLPKAEGPVSITYCYCCGGHAKHHLQKALGRKLRCTVRSSALASGGSEPCTFLFELGEPITVR